MRAVICAYGEVGHECLAELLALGADIGLVVTHADAPGERIWFRSVAELARSAGLPVVSPADVNSDEAAAAIAASRPDLLLSFYFRQMMKPRTLSLAAAGALNLHGSLLPRYRGRAPVNWVLVKGETETGVTLHYMDEKPDHGDIVAQRRVAIARDDTALRLTRKIAAEARLLLRDAYPALVRGEARREPQDHARATYFGGRRPEDGEIDWRRPAEALRNLVRAVTDPWPGAFSELRGRRLYVWSAEARPGSDPPHALGHGTLTVGGDGAPLVATGEGLLELADVSWEGEPRRPGTEWVRAAGVQPGERFGSVGEAEGRQGVAR